MHDTDFDWNDAGDAGPGSGCLPIIMKGSVIIVLSIMGLFLLLWLIGLADAYLLPQFTDFRIVDGIFSLLK